MTDAPACEVGSEGGSSGHSVTAAWAAWTGIAEVAGIGAVLQLAPAWHGLLFLVHLACVAALAFHVLQVYGRRSELSFAMIALLATIAVGPLGAFCAAALPRLAKRNMGAHLLQGWYDRIALSVAIDPVTRFSDDVSGGRAINLSGAAPSSFIAMVERGSLAERQTVLSIIARKFHPDYLPALVLALRSPEPVIRVQAAAVASHVRPEIARLYRVAVGDLESACTDAQSALQLMLRLRAMVQSGLLDESDRRQGTAIMNRLGDITLAGLRRGEEVIPRHASIHVEVPLTDMLERLLIERECYAELRSWRSAQRSTASRPLARVRRITSPHLREASA